MYFLGKETRLCAIASILHGCIRYSIRPRVTPPALSLLVGLQFCSRYRLHTLHERKCLKIFENIYFFKKKIQQIVCNHIFLLGLESCIIQYVSGPSHNGNILEAHAVRRRLNYLMYSAPHGPRGALLLRFHGFCMVPTEGMVVKTVVQWPLNAKYAMSACYQ